MSAARAAIYRIGADPDDGLPSMSYEGAKVQCSKCDGWSGLLCPHGCGVRLVSTKREDDERYHREMAEQEAGARLVRALQRLDL